jgi:diacylglycerol kinase family enzyme
MSAVGQLRCTLYNGTDSRTVEIATRNLAICNGRFFGSGMQVAPMAVPDDGRFHVVALAAGCRVGFALSSLSIYSGKHVARDDVQVHECERIDVELVNDEVRSRFLLDVDGEPLGRLPIKVELLPRAVEIFVGA